MITVNLLLNKSTYVVSDELETAYSTNEKGYRIIEGENNTTKIVVNYPAEYASYEKSVELMNSKGQATRLNLDNNTLEFLLPNTMTYVGNTILVFNAVIEDVKVKWQKVIIPITATGIDFTNVAIGSPDLLEEAVQVAKDAAEGKFDGEKGEKGDTGDTGPIGPQGPAGLGGNVTVRNLNELEAGKLYKIRVYVTTEDTVDVEYVLDEEEKNLEDIFGDRITASDDTNTKYEIVDGSPAVVNKYGGTLCKSSNLFDESTLIYTSSSTQYTSLYRVSEVDTLNALSKKYGTTSRNLWISLKTKNTGATLYINEQRFNTAAASQRTIICDGGYKKINVFIYETTNIDFIKNSVSNTNMIEDGMIYDIAITDFEPTENQFIEYFEGIREVKPSGVESIGNNWLPVSESGPATSQGVTFNNLNNGGWVLSGTSTGSYPKKTIFSLANDEFSGLVSHLEYLRNNSFKMCMYVKNPNNLRLVFRISNKVNGSYNYGASTTVSSSGIFSINATLLENAVVEEIAIQGEGNPVGSNFDGVEIYPMICSSNYTPTEFIPYTTSQLLLPTELTSDTGNSYNNIPLVDINNYRISKTVGSYVDNINKELVINVLKYEDNGTTNWGGYSSTNTSGIYRLSLNVSNIGMKLPANASDNVNVICNMYESKNANETYLLQKGISFDDNGNILIYDEEFDSGNVNEFKQKLASTPLVFYYELETPIRIKLTNLTDFSYIAYNEGLEIPLTNYTDGKMFASITYNGDNTLQIESLTTDVVKLKENITKINNDMVVVKENITKINNDIVDIEQRLLDLGFKEGQFIISSDEPVTVNTNVLKKQGNVTTCEVRIQVPTDSSNYTGTVRINVPEEFKTSVGDECTVVTSSRVPMFNGQTIQYITVYFSQLVVFDGTEKEITVGATSGGTSGTLTIKSGYFLK